jgi:hypothetical protein
MKLLFMIPTIEFLNKIYIFFKNTRQLGCFVLIIIYLLYNDSKEGKLKLIANFERLKTAKSGHLFITQSGSGPKSVAAIAGRIANYSDTSEVWVETGKNFNPYVKSIPRPETGTLYPVWYTEDLQVVYARDFKTPEETVKFFKDLYASRAFKYDPFIILLSFGLLCFKLSDIYNYYKAK